VAVVPLGLDDHRRVANDLHKQVSSDGQRAILLDCTLAERPTAWFHAAEAGNDITLYCADPANQQWTNLCLRQADRVLFIAQRPRPSQHHHGSPVKFNRSVVRLILFTIAGRAEWNPSYIRARTCRSTLFITFAPETRMT
jgi:hypothetical protein